MRSMRRRGLVLALGGWIVGAAAVSAASRTERLLQRVHQIVAPLVEQLKRDPRNPLLQAKIGRYYAKAKLWPEARAYFHAAVDLEPEKAVYRNKLGIILWKQGEHDRAVEEWTRALELDPDGEARELLGRFSPGHLEPPAEVTGVDEFLEVAGYQQDFRRQEEVRKALTTFNVRKATDIVLAPSNTRTIIEDLHLHGYLARPGGPPSGVGEYLYDEQGRIYSTEYGSRTNPRGGPEALRIARGYEADAEAVLEAMSRGRPEAFEFGFVHLSNRDIQQGMERIAEGARGLRDPHAWDALLQMLLLRARAVDDPVPDAFEPVLAELARAPDEDGEGWVEPLHRWQAMALLYKDGERDFDPLPEDELDELLHAAYQREVPKQAALAALDALGGAAEDYLIRLLAADRESATGLGGVFMAMPRYGRGDGFRALVSVLERDGWKWDYWKPHAIRALTVMAGKDLGQEPGPWREVADQLYGS